MADLMLLLSLAALAEPLPAGARVLVGLPPPHGWHHTVDDLDGDGHRDIVLRIQQLCVGPDCPEAPPVLDEVTGTHTERAGLWGLMVVASGGDSLVLGAGTETALPVSDWVLVDGAPVWTHSTDKETFGPDLTTVAFLAVKNTDSGCAPGLGQSVLILSGTDAAWALVYRDGGWRYIPCGY